MNHVKNLTPESHNLCNTIDYGYERIKDVNFLAASDES